MLGSHDWSSSQKHQYKLFQDTLTFEWLILLHLKFRVFFIMHYVWQSWTRSTYAYSQNFNSNQIKKLKSFQSVMNLQIIIKVTSLFWKIQLKIYTSHVFSLSLFRSNQEFGWLTIFKLDYHFYFYEPRIFEKLECRQQLVV